MSQVYDNWMLEKIFNCNERENEMARSIYDERIIEELKSDKQKLYEKYVLINGGINWQSIVVQRVLLTALEANGLEEAVTKFDEEVKADAAKK